MNSLNVPKLRFLGFDGEWEDKTLSALSTKITDGTHDTPKPTKEGVPFLTAIHIKDGFVDYNNCYYLDQEVHNSIYKRCNPEKDDLLIVNIGAGTATCAINSVDYEFSLKNVALVKPNKEILNGNFLAQLQRKKSTKIFNQLTSGGAQPFLSLKEIGRLKIAFPTLPEQQKIASFLSAVDEKIQQLSRKKEILEQYKKGVMQQLFSGKLRFKDEDGKEYPNWEEKKLGDVAEKRIAKNKDNKINLVFTNSAVQGIVNQRDFFDKDIANQNNLLGYYIVEKNDFVYNPRISSQAPVGPISRNYLDTGIMSPLYSVFRFREGNLDFIECFFNSIVWHKHMKDISNYGARDDRMSFSTGDFYKMPIPFPCIAEQQKIANFLSGIDGKIEQVNGELVKTQEFKKGLLQQMFV